MSRQLGEPPVFFGKFGSIKVQDFFTKLERWFLANDTRVNRWPAILDSLIDQPALTAYNAAIAMDAPPGIINPVIPPEAAPGANADLVVAANNARFTAYRAMYTN